MRAQAAGARSVPTEMRTLHGARVHRVELAHPQEAPRLRERLHRAGAPTYEADVRFAYRYLIDRGIRSAVRIHGNPALSAGEWSRTVVFDEPSLEPADWTPELTTLSLDLETDPEAKQIYSVSLWGCGAQEVLLWCPDEDARAACPSGATPCADESELLTLLCRRIRELDPDVLTGWSIIDFDVPVLIRRAAAAGVALDWAARPGSSASATAVPAGSATRSSSRGGRCWTASACCAPSGCGCRTTAWRPPPATSWARARRSPPSTTPPRSSAPMRGTRSGSCGTTSPTRASPSTSWRS